MFPVFAIVTQTLLALVSFFIAWRSFVSLRKTGDEAFKAFIWCFTLTGFHILLYVIGIIHFTFYSDQKVLQLVLIFSRILLSLGILFFMKSPIFMIFSFMKKYSRGINRGLFLLIIVFSLLHLITSPAPFLSDEGIIVENIQYLWLALLMAIIPTGSSILWFFSLKKYIPANASLFFKGKIILLCLGIISAASGNLTYILAKDINQSSLGIMTVIFGYLCVAAAVSMSDVRRIFFK